MMIPLLEITDSTGFIEEFAKSNGSTIWDWFGAIIAILSLLVTVSTLVIAIKTLKSQRETQKNTAPVINIDIQKMLWKKLIFKLYCNLIRSYRLNMLLKGEKYKKKPTDDYIKGFCIRSEDYFFEEVFYSNENHFESMRKTKDELEHYNLAFTRFATYIIDNPIREDIANSILVKINNMLHVALMGYLSVFRKESVALDGHIFSPFEGGCDEDINEELAKNYEENLKELLTFLSENVTNSNLKLSNEEQYKYKDAYVLFFEKYGNGKYDDFQKKYFEYSNKYLEYILNVEVPLY